jgi:hypothetical protein
MLLLLPILGAIISRWHGGGFFRFSKVVKSLTWALPFAILVATYSIWLAPVALALCSLGKSTGHGNWFDMATMPQGTRERLEFIIRPLYGKIPEYWYDALGLLLVGITAVSGGLLIAFYDPLGALLILLAGCMKPIGYMIGWHFWISPKSTEFG